jgi:hypothetical protein
MLEGLQLVDAIAEPDILGSDVLLHRAGWRAERLKNWVARRRRPNGGANMSCYSRGQLFLKGTLDDRAHVLVALGLGGRGLGFRALFVDDASSFVGDPKLHRGRDDIRRASDQEAGCMVVTARDDTMEPRMLASRAMEAIRLSYSPRADVSHGVVGVSSTDNQLVGMTVMSGAGSLRGRRGVVELGLGGR